MRVPVAVDLYGLNSEICQGKEMVKYLYPKDGILQGITTEKYISLIITRKKLRGLIRETGRFNSIQFNSTQHSFNKTISLRQHYREYQMYNSKHFMITHSIFINKIIKKKAYAITVI